MIPILACPGLASPGQFGPITVTSLVRAYGWNSSASWNGMRSVMTAMSLIPASTASMTASFANAAGTNTMDAFALLRRTASSTASKTGTPSTFWPPLPGRLRGIHADVAQDLFRLVLVHAFDSRDDGHARVHDLEGLLDADGDRVGFRDAAKDVEQDRRRLGFQEELECLLDLPRIVRAAEV